MCEFIKKELIGKFISVYTNQTNPSSFIFGKLLAYDEKYFLLASFTQNGAFDGLLLKMSEEVFKIEFDGQYQQKMGKLIDYSDIPEFNELDFSNLPESILKLAKEKRFIVSIELINSEIIDVTGFIDEIDGDFCKTTLVDQYGLFDGHAIFSISNITQLSILSDDENIISRLTQLN